MCQLVNSRTVLGDNGSFGTCGYGRVLCQEAGIASHHLNEEYALVGGGCVAYLIHALHDGVQGGVVTYGEVGAVQVVVYSSGQADARHVIFLCEESCAGERAVAADDDKSIDAGSLHVLVSFGTALFCHEILAACGLQNCSSATDDIADALGGEVLDFIVNQALIATIYTFHAEAVCYGSACHGTDSRIHSRCVASGRENADAMNLTHRERV